jgi:two-component system KDP operon response regulator KdpE
VIAIVSSSAHERAAIANLCEDRGWNTIGCPSVRTVKRQLAHESPAVMLVRHQLEDGYADDVISALSGASAAPSARIIVLLSASASASSEVRLIEMGADCVQRDPFRSEVVLAYLAKYIRLSRTRRTVADPSVVHFAGAVLNPLERTLRLDGSMVSLTPREVMLVEILAESQDRIVTYDTLYSEVLGRRFRGETSNMRVLLGKLGSSIKPLGLVLQNHVDVIPKTGYRYRFSKRDRAPRTKVKTR